MHQTGTIGRYREVSVTQLPARSVSGSVLPAVSRWIVDPAAGCLPVLRGEISSFARRAGLAPKEVEDAVLITNELVSNAIDHARTQCRVTMRLTASTVRIFVSDHSSVAPVLRTQGRHALRGRGIRIVASLARRWGWNGHHGGKTVWASMDRAPA
jgi:anti-sigma regulatory factor (Ser/Thr protein kinase)